MHSFSTIATLSLVAAAQAQYSYGGGGSSTNNADGAKIAGVNVVKVGDGGLTFSPNSLTVAVGEVVEFHFYPQAHSVAQSSFDAPCQPLNTSTGFFSGAVPVASGMGTQVYTVTVTDTKPKWFYCATGRHCQSGMVGVINPPAGGNTVEMYAAAAALEPSNVKPASVQGGTLGPAATSAPTTTGKPNAGMPAVGDARWGLLTFGLAVAGMVGGFLI